MTSRSEISACPSFPPPSALWPLDILWPCRSRTCCCLRGRHKERVWLLTLDRISLFLSVSFSPSLLSFCDVRPLLGHTICQNLCLCVCTKHFRWGGCSSFAWRLFRFSAFHSVVYALLVHQHVLYGILMLMLQGSEPFFFFLFFFFFRAHSDVYYACCGKRHVVCVLSIRHVWRVARCQLTKQSWL